MAWAALQVDAPTRALQGSAVLVHLTSDHHAQDATLHWRKKNMHVAMTKHGDLYVGQVFLPMPLEGDEPLVLNVTTNQATERHSITPIPVAWPRQEIQVDKKYVEPPAETMRRIKREQEQTRAVLHRVSPGRLWELPCVMPVPEGITSVFGGQRLFNGQPRSRHRGVDLRGAEGTPVLAMAGGKVVIATEQYFSGNVVYIDHGQGMVSLYAHLSALSVTEGELVEGGQTIGRVGATGRVTGPHLHWGVNILGFPVDPLSLVPEADRPLPVQEKHE